MQNDVAHSNKLMVKRFLRRRGLVAVADKSSAGHLAVFGLTPDVVFDVGVDTGTPFLYDAFPQAKFVLIDPRVESRAAMAALPDAYFVQTALGARDGRMTLHIPHNDAGEMGARASLHLPTGPMAEKITSITTRDVPVSTLDKVAAQFPGRVGLKIDTEGAEADVLAGAKKTLRRCDFVILEMSLTQRFEQTPMPSQIFAPLAAAGLEFRDVLRSTGDGRGGPAPRLMDILFTRWPSAARPNTIPA